MIQPNHIAIIMDGNGRWGKKNFKNRLSGHKHGVENIKPVIEYCINCRIKNLTIYAFSKDNFVNRKKDEIKNLFLLFEKYLIKNLTFFKNNKVNLNFIGETTGLPTNIKNLIKRNNKEMKFSNFSIQLNVAFNYSSKSEIINAVKTLQRKKIKINDRNIQKFLYTASSENPEILIRTGGYSRLSDFLLWQCAYTELFFLDKYWPDFKVSDLKKIIYKFNKIKRNFGA